MQPGSYARHQFPAEIIRHAVWLYFRFTLLAVTGTLGALYLHTRGKRRFHFSPARSGTEASRRSDLCPPAWLALLVVFPRGVSVRPLKSREERSEAAAGSAAVGSTISSAAETGAFKLTLVVGAESGTALRPA